MKEKPLQEPKTGGRYRRNADGSLEQIHATKPAELRANRRPRNEPAMPSQPVTSTQSKE